MLKIQGLFKGSWLDYRFFWVSVQRCG
jgi:hypothetical protein